VLGVVAVDLPAGEAVADAESWAAMEVDGDVACVTRSVTAAWTPWPTAAARSVTSLVGSMVGNSPAGVGWPYGMVRS
jgi:hypothetical protein